MTSAKLETLLRLEPCGILLDSHGYPLLISVFVVAALKTAGKFSAASFLR